MLILDFNDAELRVFDKQRLLASSPAYAVLDGQDFILGEAARERARLNPRASYLQFWEQLDQQALNRPAGKAKSHADIAYFHLQSLWQAAGSTDNEVLLAVPAQYGSERLALLLGITQACGLKVRGVGESALLAVAENEFAGQAIRYLDISRHRIYCTDIAAGESPAVIAASELATAGLDWCVEQCIRQIARRFLLETRFDPLHEAASEQRLYDRLPQLLEALCRGESVGVSLPAGQREHRVEWRLSDAREALEPAYQDCEKAARDAGTLVLISHRLARLPGLLARLQSVANCRVLADNALACGAERYREQLLSDGDSPLWVKQISREPESGAVRAGTDPRDFPSHLLRGHEAQPIIDGGNLPGASSAARFLLSSEGVCLTGADKSILLNGQPCPSEAHLTAGDRLSAEGLEFLLIRVESER